jgi:hypothetical protein
VSDDQGALLELYKTAIEMADRTTARRAGANSFFLTLNTVLVTVVGIVSAMRTSPPRGNLPSFDAFGVFVTAFAGVVLALIWWLLLRYYRRLNGAKFDVINKLEKRLPAKPFTDEWTILHPGERIEDEPGDAKPWWRRWRRSVEHREASLVEQVVPFVFMSIYLTLGIGVLVR